MALLKLKGECGRVVYNQNALYSCRRFLVIKLRKRGRKKRRERGRERRRKGRRWGGKD